MGGERCGGDVEVGVASAASVSPMVRSHCAGRDLSLPSTECLQEQESVLHCPRSFIGRDEAVHAVEGERGVIVPLDLKEDFPHALGGRAVHTCSQETSPDTAASVFHRYGEESDEGRLGRSTVGVGHHGPNYPALVDGEDDFGESGDLSAIGLDVLDWGDRVRYAAFNFADETGKVVTAEARDIVVDDLDVGVHQRRLGVTATCIMASGCDSDLYMDSLGMFKFTPPSGYLHPSYAASLSSLGQPHVLPRSGGVILKRRIPGSEREDAMGLYPLFCCANWAELQSDIEDLRRSGLVSLVLVTDPFGPLSEATLSQMFDRVIPFKRHYCADLSSPPESYISGHRRRLARKALDRISIQVSPQPREAADDWSRLYAAATRRRRMTGFGWTSPADLETLLSTPGIAIFKATRGSETVGMHIEMPQDDIVYGHLAAYSDEGYEYGVSYALHLYEISFFADKARWIDWGGVAGASDVTDGLASFKMGFSNLEKIAYLCCVILDDKEYDRISTLHTRLNYTYFPAYRNSEFV